MAVSNPTAGQFRKKKIVYECFSGKQVGLEFQEGPSGYTVTQQTTENRQKGVSMEVHVDAIDLISLTQIAFMKINQVSSGSITMASRGRGDVTGGDSHIWTSLQSE